MPLPTGFPYPLGQTVEIPLEQIIPNPDQPRRSMRKESLETLAASMKAKGQLTPAKVRPLTEAERAAHPGVWVMLIGGHRRRQAAVLNHFQTFKCNVEEIAPEDTHYQALMDNDYEEMDWWDWDLAIERESKTFTGTIEELAVRLNKGLTKVYGALKIAKAFNPASRALVDENLEKSLKNDLRPAKSKNKGFSITENALLVLADLENPNQVQQALQAVLDDYLTEAQTKKLVEHLKTGGTVETFGRQPAPAAVKTPPDSPHQGDKNHVPSGSVQPKHETPVVASTQATPVQHPTMTEDHQKAPHASHPAPTPEASNNASPFAQVAAELLAGISLMRQVDAKIKKGEKLTTSEWILLILYRTGKVLAWVFKIVFKLVHALVKWFWKEAKDITKTAFKSLGQGFKKVVGAAVTLVVFCFLVWFAYAYFFQHDVWIPVRTMTSWYHSGQKAPASNGAANSPAPAVASQPQKTATVVSRPARQAKVTGTPTVTPQATQPSTAAQAPTQVPTKGPDLLGQVGKVVSPLDAANAVKHLLPF